ncbi:MAG: aminoacyl-tRNA hydrolase [Candidatus Poribacteria bacterium]|nr:aminoacyl-tRNA hydrolase [Candidatus Poribacteria bacterium]
MKLIVGLGNPGQRYKNTRHNIGFRVIDELLKRARTANMENICQSLVAQTELRGNAVMIAKPMTYMNHSGRAVSEMLHQFDIALEDLCVVYDDLHLDIGILRIRRTGSDGGHKGIKSIQSLLNTHQVPLVRIGIGKPENDHWVDYVLSEFLPAERQEIDYMIQRAADAVETLTSDGIQTAMNRFNGRAG